MPVGLKVYFVEPRAETVTGFARFSGYLGGGVERYEGERTRLRYAGASTGIGVAYFVREALALGTELGIGWASRSGDQSTDHYARLSWRFSLVLRFGTGTTSA